VEDGMSWSAPNILSALATILAPCTDGEETVKRVYQYPPASLAETPCIVLRPGRMTVRRSYSTRWTDLAIRAEVYVPTTGDYEDAAERVWKYLASMADLLDQKLNLNATVDMQDFATEPIPIELIYYGDAQYLAGIARIDTTKKEATTFGT
jgi:hypothetical protein